MGLELSLFGNATRRFEFTIWRQDIVIDDQAESKAAKYIARELKRDSYGLANTQFSPGDSVIDIGAHVGLFSIALALRFPFLRIHAYEPYPPNRRLLEKNLLLNGVTQVSVYPEALTGDGREIEMTTNPVNSGGASAFATSLEYGRYAGIPSIRLDDVFERHAISRCAVLKIDCEGAEYEVLYAAHVWERIGFLCGEFHENQHLKGLGYTAARLMQFCGDRMTSRKVCVSQRRMSE